jgi:hypothetical protein
MVEAYWDIGRQIMEAQNNNPRAEYGAGLIKYLAERLTAEFGKGFDESSLRRMRQFFQMFPIRAALRHELSWTHYRLLMKIDEPARLSRAMIRKIRRFHRLRRLSAIGASLIILFIICVISRQKT